MTLLTPKQTIFSGMQPSGVPSLGNYVGAIRNWGLLQERYNCLYCVVDMHAITVRQDPATLRAKARNLLALYIAAGLDPEKNIIYIQSHVREHAELAWVLNCFSYMGELSRMTQFKEKSSRHEENINVGLFAYPVLQAADILLYQADLVPVGEDQKQHIELCRDIAVRFNNIYGETFKIPDCYIGEDGARIMSLQDPAKKMSKSETENLNNAIFLLDEPNIIMNKFKRAVTDSGSEICFAPDKPGITNLLTIYLTLTNRTKEQTLADFGGKGYGDLKRTVGEIVVSEFAPIQKRYKELTADKPYLDQVMKTNAEKAGAIAARTLSKVYKKIGFITN
jgi:tryptophanyl-tRNA synthetase